MAENGDYSQTELDEFCSIFFESIEAGLLADKYVKIKGFGTFKLINVSDRESINVNTGERIQISGHAKASFIPDNDLKDLINSPFAHFQTVAINDETNLEEMASIANDDVLEMEQALETEETDGGQNPLNESSDEEMPEKEDLSLLSQRGAENVVQQGDAATAQSKVASPEPSTSLGDGLGQDCVDNPDGDVSSDEAVGTEVTENLNRHVDSDVEDGGLPFDKEKNLRMIMSRMLKIWRLCLKVWSRLMQPSIMPPMLVDRIVSQITPIKKSPIIQECRTQRESPIRSDMS